MNCMQREKGAVYERWSALEFRGLFREAAVPRTSQVDRAERAP
jgi:hypothetical protein